ncbi:Hypothetical predicted protein, partial [Mytilus galloprovincialis]
NAVLVKKMKKDIFLSDESNFEMSSQETCSQESSWSLSSVGRLEIRNGIHQLNNAVHMLDSKISPVKYMIKKDLNESNASTVRYVKRKANETIHCVLDQIAPAQSSKILELVGADIKPFPVRVESDTSITNLIAKLYSESDNNMLKCQLLSLISSPNMHTKSELMELIPDLTKHKIDQSRTHASQHGPGSLPLKKELSHRNRMDEVKLDHALSFFLNPDFQQICSYGTKKLEFDNGEVVTIPQIVRTTCHSLLIDMYASYCNEEHFNPLSKSTQFKLLATCAAAKRSNLSGLDNITADGAASMDNIIATLKKLQEHDISKDELEETTSDVKALKLYMKTMYKFDIKTTSHCKDHCIHFALSNTKDVLLQESCTDHIHDDVCNSCNLLGNVTEQIFKSIQKVSDEESRDDLYTTTTIDINNVKQWKAHQLRTKNQDEARLKLMESLEPHQLLLVMDWAMKFLPMRYREKQSDFFGQKGLNWHVSVAIVKPENATLQHKTYVHLFDGVRQDWFAVASIIENTVMTIKKQMPNIEEIFLRSDNAGCYHCGCLWLSLYGISQRTGLKILRYDYSEAQSGKSFCDAKIAHMRSKMKMFVSSGNNISSAEEMKAAIMSGAGVTGCQCAVADVDTSKQEMTSHRFKGVNSFSNLEFQDSDILVWNSYNIGIGKKIPRSSVLRQEQGETGLNVLNDFSEPRATYGAIKSKENSTTANHQESDIFECPEPGCCATFSSFHDIETHQSCGRHLINGLSTYEKVRKCWVETCNANFNNTINFSNMSDRGTEGTSSEDMGWALRKERKFVRFSTEVKDFLKQEFEAGEISGKKSNPVTTSINMRTKVDEHGVRVFKADQFLQPSQIASFFARLSVMSKKTAPQQGTLDLPEENDDDLFNIIREIEEGEIREVILNEDLQ